MTKMLKYHYTLEVELPLPLQHLNGFFEFTNYKEALFEYEAIVSEIEAQSTADFSETAQAGNNFALTLSKVQQLPKQVGVSTKPTELSTVIKNYFDEN